MMMIMMMVVWGVRFGSFRFVFYSLFFGKGRSRVTWRVLFLFIFFPFKVSSHSQSEFFCCFFRRTLILRAVRALFSFTGVLFHFFGVQYCLVQSFPTFVILYSIIQLSSEVAFRVMILVRLCTVYGSRL
jgi:hypothetical protein